MRQTIQAACQAASQVSAPVHTPCCVAAAVPLADPAAAAAAAANQQLSANQTLPCKHPLRSCNAAMHDMLQIQREAVGAPAHPLLSHAPTTSLCFLLRAVQAAAPPGALLPCACRTRAPPRALLPCACRTRASPSTCGTSGGVTGLRWQASVGQYATAA
jgi:hypothetical protein